MHSVKIIMIKASSIASYKIIPEKKIVIEYFKGSFNAKQLKLHKIELSQDDEYSPSYNLLSDISEAEIDVFVDEIETYANFIKSTPSISGQRRLAIVTQSAHQVACSTIFSEFFSEEDHQEIGIFSTYRSAVKFLKSSSVTERECIDMLTSLRHKFNK